MHVLLQQLCFQSSNQPILLFYFCQSPCQIKNKSYLGCCNKGNGLSVISNNHVADDGFQKNEVLLLRVDRSSN
jgi:hypothetical protein